MQRGRVIFSLGCIQIEMMLEEKMITSSFSGAALGVSRARACT
jgi:hypothetical protein